MSRLAAIVESSNDAIIGKDLNGIITSWNKGAEKIFGYTAGEMVGASILRLFPPDRQAEEDYILGKIRRGEKVEQFETVRQTKDGRLIDISVTSSPIRDAAGDIIGASIIARDITMQKAHEEEILRLSRLYAALSQINQAIIWTRQREALFEKICRVLVELGKFSMAWIGQADAETAQVKVAARWGDKTDALSQVVIYADDRPEGHGPTGTAIREGTKDVRNDFFNEIRHPQWREWAKRAGFRAAAAFPIRQNKKVWGALTVYSDETAFFQDKEAALLIEAASDISFALDFLAREDSLRETEERYEALFDRSLDCVFLTDFHGNFLDANQAALDLLGFQRAEIKELTFASLLTGDQLPLAFKVTEEIKTTGFQKLPTEFRLRGKDGRQVHVETQGSLIRREGKPFAIQGIARDLTGRKQAENLLLASEQRLNAFFTSAPAGLALLDKQLRYLQLNETVAKINGVPMKDHLGKTIREILPKLAPMAEPLLQKVLATGEPMLNVELSGETPSQPGVPRQWLESFFPIMGKDGSPEGIGVIFVEITGQKRAEEAQARLATAVEQSAESIMITDPKGTILYVNPAFEKITGYTRAEALGQNPRILKSGKHDAAFYRRMWEALKSGKTWHGHFINLGKDGKPYEVEANISPVRDATGAVVNYVAVQRDVTREMQLKAQFRQSQKMEAFGQLAGGVAHDFNNILAVIQLQTGLLKSEPNLSLEQLELAGDIEKAAERGANLTRQLLLFSRKQTMQPRNLKLKDIVENMTKMLQRTLGERFQFQCKFAGEPLIIHADPGMIDQILLNLVVNARDAMPEGGRIIIETSAVEFDDDVAARTARARPGSFACLTVSDTGCGIPPEVLPHIFEPFFTTKEVGKGSGLGLATVFGIVQQHEGWINVYSEAGRGTTFRVYLPRQTKASDTEFLWTAQSSLRGGSETILLVEDEPALRSSVRASLLRLGYQVLEAANGEEALAVWKQNPGVIRLLLTDLVMPGGLTGKELAQQLLQLNPRLKVIYSSGYSVEVAGTDLVLEDGVNFLAKPFQPHKLAQTIRQSLDAPAAGT